ncbi:hypothetical protein [Methylobacterium fujisawaense]|uniref:hypothetical protein n=1 Tax=Methylobacterium fujisawaense TaxID=107400 RepID=UPI002F35ADD3
MSRAQLTNRRSHEAFDFVFSRGPNRPGYTYTCGYGVDVDGRISEIFLDSHKLASDLTDDARDMAVLLSIALQHGVPLAQIRHAVTRIEDGEPVGLAGRVLDELAKREPQAFGDALAVAPAPTELKVPCPHCADGFVSHGDRHARTKMDVCSACGGTHEVPAATGQTPEASFDPADDTEAAASRDVRQEQMRRWIGRILGEGALHPHERVERLLEETVELAQAERLPAERIGGIVAHVYAKEPGEPAQEVGGISTCLLAYCAATAVSADACERAELTRILGKTPEHFRARHQAKVDAGMARSFDHEVNS